MPDVRELTWDTIIELRKDVDARMRLRRLRVFAATEYVGKSRAFIEDDISVRVDDYEHTLKRWGVKTIIGCLSSCLTLETTLPVTIASIVTAMSGLPEVANAFAASLVIPCTRFTLELSTMCLAREEAICQYPLAYAMELKKISHANVTSKQAAMA